MKSSPANGGSRKFFDPLYLCNEKLAIRKDRKEKVEVLNASASFDIESTSFMVDGLKCACMYVFVLGLNGKVIFGRTWKDLFDDLKAIKEAYSLDPEKRILKIFIHNFSYEWQFFRKWFNWISIFATEERKPVRALCDMGIEFCDSYILSGLSLDATANDLTKYKIKKLKGALDYSKLRHSETILTPEEWHYVENDGLSLMAFIQEEIEKNNNNITQIPLTKTGYVRKYMKNECYHDGQRGHGERRKIKSRSFGTYRKIMDNLTLEVPEYILSTEVFQGGFTHTNIFNVGMIFNDVASYDLTSAYPAALVLQTFPMGKGTYIENPSAKELKDILKYYHSIFRVKIYKLRSKWKGDHFISKSKCRELKNASIDNGRVISADYLETSITNIDLDIYKAFYTFEKIEIFDLWYYPKGYLPRNFIKGVLNLYKDKTTLKGVEGMEVEYLLKKSMLNATYGMAVTSIIQPKNIYENEEWEKEEPEITKAINDYNNNKNRFLFYLWGIFCTSWIRHSIAKTILAIGEEDYLYSDTDSVKFINWEKHKDYFEQYNASIMSKIAKSSEINKLPLDLYIPKTKEGKEKPIGVFDNEGSKINGVAYKRFKALGAKRYFVEYPEAHKMKTPKGEEIETPYSLTISGVNKTAAIPALMEKAKEEGKDIFSYFDIGFTFSEEMTGKSTHTYCDYAIKGKLIDYRGKEGRFKELSFLHMSGATYKLTTTDEYYEAIYMDHLNRLERKTRQIIGG